MAFNWPLDWFDAEFAHGQHDNNIALRVVGDGAAKRNFKQLSDDSSRLANRLRALGVKRGDPILLMPAISCRYGRRCSPG
ncbi:MAG: hypothetical protein EXR05_02730 [Acetobacteraceae bacterium]|nr:hypothetical protein [Acetobacteraceae bacterium]MSP28908.1 hypothetical protein [Acetobacteraceae bacterium]